MRNAGISDKRNWKVVWGFERVKKKIEFGF